MKTIGYISLGLWIGLFIACSRPDTAIPDVPFGGEYSFYITVPDARVVRSRGETIGDGVIENLYVLVFDQNGNFLSRTEALPGTGPGNYTVKLEPTDPGLPVEERKRIVHFISNYDWIGFVDSDNLGGHENSVVSTLSVSGGKAAYWQRVELADGIVKDALPSTIELLRNIALVSVRNNTAGSAGTNPFLTEVTFALGDYITRGTVAPFNTESQTFEEGAVVESPTGTIMPVSESDFVEAGHGAFRGDSIVCYERKNSTATRPLYVIVRGKYSGDSKPTYYKIDIVEQGREELYDIVRNHHFKLDITEVKGTGSATLQEAVNSPASNNLLYSVILEKYTSISDGLGVLHVGLTSKTFVQGGVRFEIPFSFFPEIGKAENNATVEFRLEQDAAAPVIRALVPGDIVRTAGRAHCPVETVSSVPQYDIHTARLIVTARTANTTLRRVIQLRLRHPSEFGDLRVTPNPIPKTAGTAVDVAFTLPSSISGSQFPMFIYITANNLSPNLDPGQDNELVLDYQIPGRYRYRYRALSAGDHTVHFKTVSPAFSENLIVEAELFETGQVPMQTLP